MSGLEQEFPGKVVASNEDATLPEAEPIIRDLGFRNHGLVVRTAGGEALWSQPDHEVNLDEVRAKLDELLKQR